VAKVVITLAPSSANHSFEPRIAAIATANAPVDLSAAAAENGARKHSLVRYCRVSSQCWHLMTGCVMAAQFHRVPHGWASVTFPQAAQTMHFGKTNPMSDLSEAGV
jgi:hypothetical protein